MHVIVAGAGIIGISTAWHLLERGHSVTVIDRQPGAALETSFANAGQISVGYCEPWANRDAPLKLLKWMFRNDAPLLFRPTLDWEQWHWGLRFLGQCHDAAFERNVKQLVALGRYSHQALQALVDHTGIEYHRITRGIAHYFCDPAAFAAAQQGIGLMQRYGVERRLLSRDEFLAIEPAYRHFGRHIVGGTYTPSDESGDAHLFTQALAQRCAQRGAHFVWEQPIERLVSTGQRVTGVMLSANPTAPTAPPATRVLMADAVVVAAGSYTNALLGTAGLRLPIYPGRGYSATFPLLNPHRAPEVSCIDDAVKCAITRLGHTLRVAGTIEVGGYSLDMTTPLARARCQMLSDRISTVLPGVCDLSQPHYWSGLRPATPTNCPFIGALPLQGLWVNAGHGTLGWTHGAGSGKALAALMDGEQPGLDFQFTLSSSRKG
jgi:D-amino-acid dehydrogenase